VHFFETSCATRDGVDAARAKGCDLLLERRVEQKVKQGKADTLRSRLHVAGGPPPASRPPCIPSSVLKKREGDAAMADEDEKQEKLERERMEELGGAGVYSVDLWKRAVLEDPTWKYDVVPEIMDGQNIYDFVDPDIEKKLALLEKEEALLMQEATLRDDDQVLNEFSKTQDVLDELHSRMRQRRLERKLNKNRNHAPTLRKGRKKAEDVEKKLNDQGLDGSKVRSRSAAKTKRGSSLLGKRKRDATAEGGEELAGRAGSAARAASARSMSRMKGLPSEDAAQTMEKRRRKKMKLHEKQGKKGEADHHIPDWKPKHLFSGKRGIGKTDRR